MNNIVSEFPLERPFVPNGGYAFVAALPKPVIQLVQTNPIAIVLEDGEPLGPGNVQHTTIRNHGRGAFSLWAESIYFSASDNTDCNENDRAYSLGLIEFSKHSAVYRCATERFARDDAELLRLITTNYSRNNNLFMNFLKYFNDIMAVLGRHDIDLPETAIEIGPGPRPYTALRFLLEGTKRFVVNDVLPVQHWFEREFIQDLRSFLRYINFGREAELDGIILASGTDKVAIKGLEIHDRQPFEMIAIDDQVDFIFSTSVLEHVMQPSAVARKMALLLRPGGYAWHSIDLRDHRDFNAPLAFLGLSTRDYASINSENRLRTSDWLEVFQGVGFDTIECVFGTFKSGSVSAHEYRFTQPEQPWVDAHMRAKFKPPFDTKELADLSILTLQILCRKRT